MSLIRGSRGLIYFVHQFKPSFQEAALLKDPEMLAAITAINAEIQELAPVLNSTPLADAVECESSPKDTQIAFVAKQHRGMLHVFAVNLRNARAEATFRLRKGSETAETEVIGEKRTVPIRNHTFSDSFAPYEVHLYRMAGSKQAQDKAK